MVLMFVRADASTGETVVLYVLRTALEVLLIECYSNAYGVCPSRVSLQGRYYHDNHDIECNAVYLTLNFHSTTVRSFVTKNEVILLSAKLFISMLLKHCTTTILVRLLSPL
jgi:hypothetical protein